jgi:hypothetical protein
VNEALSVAAGATLMRRLVLDEPEALLTVNVTLKEPEDVNVWLGF